jgi:hypothetical protein
MGLFSRNTEPKQPATVEQCMEIGRLVNEGNVRKANKLTKQTADPKATAFEAFRYIDVLPPED